MWVREAMFRWLIPAAVILPLWLLIGWAVTGACGWALLFLVFAMPVVFFGQLLLTLLVRVRTSVRVSRALSWWDVAGFAALHVLTVLTGLFLEHGFGWTVAGSIVAAQAVFWGSLWQLWGEARDAGGIRVVATRAWADRARVAQDSGVFVVQERPEVR